MFKSILLGMCVACVALPALADAPQDKYNEWLKLEANETPKMFNSMLNPSSMQDAIYALDYLKQRITVNYVVDASYFTTYAQLLWGVGLKDSGAAFADTAVLILKTDMARCADKTAGQTRYVNTLRALKEPLEYNNKASAKEQAVILGTAMALEEKIKGRRGNRSVCGSGIQGMSQKITLMQEGKLTSETVADPEQPGKKTVILHDSPDVKVDFIADDVWHARREDIRNGFKSYIFPGQAAGNPSN